MNAEVVWPRISEITLIGTPAACTRQLHVTASRPSRGSEDPGAAAGLAALPAPASGGERCASGLRSCLANRDVPEVGRAVPDAQVNTARAGGSQVH